MRTVTLYTRPGCHLCDEAQALLRRAARGLDVTVAEVNIDEDPALRARYGERVPVLATETGELDWPFSEAEARRLLGGR
jgi:glutaredoxin